MKKRQFVILILLLVIGFASVTTTLVLNGKVGVGVELDDFDVIFIEALLDGKEDTKATISEDKKTITFSTDKFINKGESARLDYKVKNTSTQYNADVEINCTNEAEEYIGVTSEFDGNQIPLANPVNIKAQEVKSGYINAELIKSYTGGDTSIEIKCTINVAATSRENYAYTVNFDSDGGSEVGDKIVIYDKEYGALEEPVREGYTFIGWYDEEDNKIDNTTILSSKGHKTLKAKWKYICPYATGKTWNFNYTGGEQTFTTPCDGEYKIELWGASGGNAFGIASNYGGLGAFVSGSAFFFREDQLFINVGGRGANSNNTGTAYDGNYRFSKGGYNGGGNSSGNGYCVGAGGGGATHLSLVSGLLSKIKNKSDVLMVAAGGGGASRDQANRNTYEGNGGAGGILNGYNGSTRGNTQCLAYGASQTSGGKSCSASYYGFFGGSDYTLSGSRLIDGGGGGSGYYGGGNAICSGGGGGSSYVNENSRFTINNTNYVFNNIVTADGKSLMPTHSGTGNMTGNSGNGYAKITLVSID